VEIILVPALVLTLTTLLIAALVWAGFWIFQRRPESFWLRALSIHGFLFVVHSMVTIPLLWGFVMPRFMVHTRGDEARYRGPRIAADGSWQIQSRETLLEEAAKANRGETTPEARANGDADSKFVVHFVAGDGVPLRGFLVPSRKPTPRFVAVLVHGLFRGGCELETVGSMLRDAGGEVLLLELRNHGGSGRARATFGRDESQDVVAAVKFLRERPEERERPLVLFGVSLGTAAVMIASPKIERLAGLILDAPIDDLYATGDRMLGGLAKRRALGPDIPKPMRALILYSAQHLGGVDFAGAATTASLCRISPKIPILLIGAGVDDRVPMETTQALFDKLPTEPDRKQIWLVEAATHGKVWEAEPEEYRKRVASLLDLAVGPEQ
jgi:alpha-beta hydrolase superfamily lysophospholipase